MKRIKLLLERTGILLAALFLCLGMKTLAAPAVEGDTELTAAADKNVSANFTVTSDGNMESVTLRLGYDKDALTYISGSGGNSFSGSGGNGLVELSSKPGTTEASFSVSFRGKSDGETQLEILSCKIVVDGEEIDVLGGEDGGEDDEDWIEDESGKRASFVIDGRTFYVHHPDSIDDFDSVHMDIQGIDSSILKHDTLDIYVVKLWSDNGSYRDNFVYNPDTGNVIPFVQMEAGSDDVIFIEPEENGYVPANYALVDLGWGPKYTIPALKHYTVDGIDEILDDTNRYLIYGINQDGEKAWYSFDYDKNALQLFDDIAYQGEQNVIAQLNEEKGGLAIENDHLRNRYDTDMGRRLMIILALTLIVFVLLNVLVVMLLRMRRMRRADDGDEEDDESAESAIKRPKSFVTGNLEENETDFSEPSEEGEDIELEIIDLDDLDD